MLTELQFQFAMAEAARIVEAEIARADREIMERINNPLIDDADRLDFLIVWAGTIERMRTEALQIAREYILSWKPPRGPGDGVPVPLAKAA